MDDETNEEGGIDDDDGMAAIRATLQLSLFSQKHPELLSPMLMAFTAAGPAVAATRRGYRVSGIVQVLRPSVRLFPGGLTFRAVVELGPVAGLMVHVRDNLFGPAEPELRATFGVSKEAISETAFVLHAGASAYARATNHIREGGIALPIVLPIDDLLAPNLVDVALAPYLLRAMDSEEEALATMLEVYDAAVDFWHEPANWAAARQIAHRTVTDRGMSEADIDEVCRQFGIEPMA